MGKNNVFTNIRDWIEDNLRRLCGEITPDKRVIVVVTMLVLFSGLSIYMTVSSVYNFGKDKGRRLEIERIETLKLEPEIKVQERDSINLLNDFEYGRTTEE